MNVKLACSLAATLGAALIGSAAAAQGLPANAPAGACLPYGTPAERDARLHTDWAWMARYKADDQALAASGQPVDVVFMGDSITEGWYCRVPAYFRPGLVGRGIGGQTTPQMVVRFRQDVLDLKPKAVHIMMGTNDIAANTGPMTVEQTEANFKTLTELAQAHGIKVILASIPPSAGFPWAPTVATVDKIRTLNAWIKAYAASVGAVYADYTSVLDNGQGGMKPGISIDGVHPNPDGYALMRPVADAAIATALGK